MTTTKVLAKVDDNPPAGILASALVSAGGGLAAANNLSDVASPSAALANLGGITKATAQGVALVQALIFGS